MDYRVSYEHSLASAPNAFLVHVPDQVITDLSPQRSPQIGRIRRLRIL